MKKIKNKTINKQIIKIFLISLITGITIPQIAYGQQSPKIAVKCKKWETKSIPHNHTYNAPYKGTNCSEHNNGNSGSHTICNDYMDIKSTQTSNSSPSITICTEWELDIMELMSAMPEIGISRVDPNLIEY